MPEESSRLGNLAGDGSALSLGEATAQAIDP